LEKGYYGDLHGQFLDKNNHKLYIFGGEDAEITISFNLITKEINYDQLKELCQCEYVPRCIFIPSPLNEVHIFDSIIILNFKQQINPSLN